MATSVDLSELAKIFLNLKKFREVNDFARDSQSILVAMYTILFRQHV